MISKARFTGDKYTIVTGKIVDDKRPYNSLNVILTNPNGHIFPNQETYSFERTPMPEDLAEYYKNSLDKQHKLEELLKQREERQRAVDPLERKQMVLERAVRMSARTRKLPEGLEETAQDMSEEAIRKMKFGKTADHETGEIHDEHKLAAKVQKQKAQEFILQSRLKNERK